MPHLDLIAEMARDFAASQDIGETLRNALRHIADCVGAEAASLFLIDPVDDALECRACFGPVDITGLRLPAGQGIIGRAVAENSPRIVRETRQDPDFRSAIDRCTGFVTRSVLCAPMSRGEDRLGAIELVNKRAGGLFDVADRQLLQALAAAAGLALVNARLAAAMAEQEAMRRELALAAEIQRGMLPPRQPDTAPIHGLNRPAGSVSGDFFDMLRRRDGCYAFAIGDVSGKGVNAALLMARTSSLFRCLAKTISSPGRLLAAVNAELCETGPTGVFVTMAAGTYDPASREVVFANAGHEPALWHRRGDNFLALPAQAPPLAIAEGLVGAAVPENVFSLDEGALYLFTDGLTEIACGDRMLGEAGVRAAILAQAWLPPGQRIDALVAAMVPAGVALRDDLTLLLVDPGTGR